MKENVFKISIYRQRKKLLVRTSVGSKKTVTCGVDDDGFTNTGLNHY